MTVGFITKRYINIRIGGVQNVLLGSTRIRVPLKSSGSQTAELEW